MSIKDDWDKGTKFEKHFNNLADKAYPLVGELRRVAIYELDNTGHAFYASNRPRYGTPQCQDQFSPKMRHKTLF